MPSIGSLDELTRRNVAIIAEMEKAAAHVRTRGDRIADQIAAWVGSWSFIIAQSVILFFWIVLNLAAWVNHWDPYPFILLNLALSFQSAYAAPVLLISQNRQAKLSERRNHLDLQINMLAEQETTEILHLLRLLCERSGVRLGEDDNGRSFEEQTNPAEIVRQIRGEMEEGAVDTIDVRKEVVEAHVETSQLSPRQLSRRVHRIEEGVSVGAGPEPRHDRRAIRDVEPGENEPPDRPG